MTRASATSFDEVFALAVSAPLRLPHPGASQRLRALFRELAMTHPPRPADDIEELIWAHWIGHADGQAARTMAIAAESMAAGQGDLARPMFDALIAAHPDWAEAWNKRATLHFIQKHDADAIADIGETLRLEPRHFGALAGFAQICLRGNRPIEARALFQLALALNPHLQGVREIVEGLAGASARLN